MMKIHKITMMEASHENPQTLFILIVIALAAAFCAVPAKEASAGTKRHSIQCGCCDLASVGEPKTKLIECYGEPAYKEEKKVTTRQTTYHKRYRNGVAVVESGVEEIVEYWFYEIGGKGWWYKFEIRGGKISAIEDL